MVACLRPHLGPIVFFGAHAISCIGNSIMKSVTFRVLLAPTFMASHMAINVSQDDLSSISGTHGDLFEFHPSSIFQVSSGIK